MKHYSVSRREAIVAAIETALKQSGAEVVVPANPKLAPFEITAIEPTTKKALRLICYAFTANKYRQSGRPLDEHRFQVKYGSEFDRYHELYFDPTHERVTLMFGVHLEMGLFVSVDPRMHSPTWFSRSVEFKTEQLERARTNGWHGWERERSDARRKLVRPQESLLTETVIAFTPDQFLSYVELERLASGFDCGQRLLLSDRIEQQLVRQRLGPKVVPHVLEAQFGIAAERILDLIHEEFRLAAAVRGSVAEHHLERYLRNVRGIETVTHLHQDGEADFSIEYEGKSYKIECKNVLRHMQGGRPKVDFQKTRAAKSNPCSRYYGRSQFQVLAACLYPVTQKWEFRFVATSALPSHKTCPGRIASTVLVDDTWSVDLAALLKRL